jgi:hypothetical protein
MGRSRLLVFTAIGLLVFAGVYWIWSGWGLITVHADGVSLSQVMRTIEKQGGVQLRTNLEPDQPVTMHVDKVPLREALETLSAVTDARWRLTYLFGPDQATLERAVSDLSSGTRQLEGWTQFELPDLRGDTEEAIGDPRRLVWEVKAPAEATLQAWLRSAAIGVPVGFACPESFNPAVAKAPSSGEIRKRAPDLAKAGGAKMQEVFLLLGRRGDVAEGPPPPETDENGEGRRRREGMGAMMRERRELEIAKLPPAQREAAQRQMEEVSSFMQSLRDLSPEERRAKREEFFQNGDRTDRMEDRRMQREERQTPEQRRERYQKYVSRKRAAQTGGAQ